MNLINMLYVAAGGAAGSVLRYAFMTLIGHNLGNDFPYSTLIVNVSGSLVMGLFIGWLVNAAPENENALKMLFAVGVLGGYTTFSSFALDAVTLYRGDKITDAAFYICASVLLSLAAVFAGMWMMRKLG